MLKYFRYVSPSFVFFNSLQKHQPHQPGHKKNRNRIVFAVPALYNSATAQGIGTCHSYIVVRRSALSVSFSPNLLGGIFLPIISFQIFILSDYFISYQTVSAAKINHFPSTAITCVGKF